MKLSKEKINNCDIQDNFLSISCGKVIKKTRKENGMTGSELARKMNISQQQMSRYERGINKISIDMLFKIAMILNIPFENVIKSIISEAKESWPNKFNFIKNERSNSDIMLFY